MMQSLGEAWSQRNQKGCNLSAHKQTELGKLVNSQSWGNYKLIAKVTHYKNSNNFFKTPQYLLNAYSVHSIVLDAEKQAEY